LENGAETSKTKEKQVKNKGKAGKNPCKSKKQ
jgi:hypothetical protein